MTPRYLILDETGIVLAATDDELSSLRIFADYVSQGRDVRRIDSKEHPEAYIRWYKV